MFALVAFAACNNDPEPEQPVVEAPVETPPPAQTDEPPATDQTEEAEQLAWTPNEIGPTMMRVAWWGGDARHNAVNAALELFMDRYPHIMIQPEYGAFGGYLDTLQLQMAAQDEPDLFLSNYAWVHALGSGNNAFANLNDFAHIIDLDEWSPALRAFTTTADGELAGVPHGITGRVIIYNQELLAAHGRTSFPATFDEWVEWGIEVAEGNLAIDAGDNTYAFFPVGPETMDIVVLTMIYNHFNTNLQANGQILPTIDQVEYVFNVLGRMIETGTLPTLDQQEGVTDIFTPVWMSQRGGASFAWVGNIFMEGGAFGDNSQEDGIIEGLGVALLPAVEAGGTRHSMQRPSLVHAISRNTDNPYLAAYLLNFLYTDEEALSILGNAFGIPLSETAAYVFERDGGSWGLQAEGFALLEANQGTMCPLFEDPNLRPHRVAAIEAFRAGTANAREAATRWVEDQQYSLSQMQ